MEKGFKNIDLGDNLETQDEIKLFPGHIEAQKVQKKISKGMAKALEERLQNEKIEYKLYKDNQNVYIQIDKNDSEKLSKLIKSLRNREVER